MNKLMLPEVIGWIFDQLNKCDQQTPWVGPVHNEPLQQNTAIIHLIRESLSTDYHPPCDLLLNGLNIGLGKQGQQGTAEVVGVAVWIPQLVRNGIQEQVAP